MSITFDLCDCCMERPAIFAGWFAERPATFASWCSSCLEEELEDGTLAELCEERDRMVEVLKRCVPVLEEAHPLKSDPYGYVLSAVRRLLPPELEGGA